MSATLLRSTKQNDIKTTFIDMREYLRALTGLDSTNEKVKIVESAPKDFGGIIRVDEEIGSVGLVRSLYDRLSAEKESIFDPAVFQLAAELFCTTTINAFPKSHSMTETLDKMEKLYFDAVSYISAGVFGALCAYGRYEGAVRVAKYDFKTFAEAALYYELDLDIALIEDDDAKFAKSFDVSMEIRKAATALKNGAKFVGGVNERLDENLRDYLAAKDAEAPEGLDEKGIEHYWFIIGDIVVLTLLDYKSHAERFLEASIEALDRMEDVKSKTLQLISRSREEASGED